MPQSNSIKTLLIVDDSRVSRMMIRAFVLAVASLPTFALGLITLAWTAVADRSHQRRGWHDHLAHSIVVDVRPVEAHVVAVDDTPRPTQTGGSGGPALAGDLRQR